MNTIRLYLLSMRMQIRCQTQYRLSFAMQTAAQLIMEGGEMMAVLLVIDRFRALGHWSGANLLFFFGLMSCAFYLAELFGRGVTGAFPSMVRSGDLDTLLLRPRGVLTQVLCSAADPRRVACLAVGLTAIVLGSVNSGVQWDLLRLLLLIESLLMGMLLTLGLFLVECVLCLWTVRSVEMVNVLTYGGRSSCQYPIDVFPRPLRVLFTAVAPYALCLHVPGSHILGSPLWGWPLWAAFLTPLSGLAVWLLMASLFRLAMRHYRSTGS